MLMEICQRCIDERMTNVTLRWSQVDTYDWEKGHLVCWKHGSTHFPLRTDPPTDCPYAVEHLILGQKGDYELS